MGSDLTFGGFPECWELTTLGQMVDACGGSVQTGPFGSQLHAADYVDEGIPSVMPKNIAIEGIVEDDIARITVEDAKRLSKYLLAEGDIIYSRRGDVEKCALVKPEETGWLCGTGCLRVRLGPNSKITPEFLHAFLSSPTIREWVSRHAIGATMPNLNTSILRDIPVLVPEAKDIDFISASWSVFNNKIQLNRQTNQTLENMAQALFKSWFVDFDPVIDNALAAGNAIPPALEARAEQRRAVHAAHKADNAAPAPLPQAIRQLFPASFVLDAEMGWIPEGWEATELSALIDIKHGYAFKGEYFSSTPTDDILLSPGNFKIGGGFKGDKFKYYNGPIPEDYVLSHNDLLVTMTDLSKAGDTLGYPALVPDSSKYCYLHNQRLGKVIFKGESVGREFIYRCLTTKEYRDEVLASASGSTVKHTAPKKILAHSIVYSNGSVEAAFEDLCSSLSDKISMNEKNSVALEQLRDTLLPKLISGELRIPETQQQAEAIA